MEAKNATRRNGLDVAVLHGVLDELREHPEAATVTLARLKRCRWSA
jgi:hypothetical protein